MKYRPKRLVLLGTLMALAIVGAACGSGDEVASDPTASTEATVETSSPAVTNDTPAANGIFTVGEGSEATFTVNEQLSRLPLPNDAVLRTGEITGEIDLSASTATLVIDLHSLDSDEANRDRYVRNRLLPRQPEATIKITKFPDAPETFANGETFTSTVMGIVNVNGADAEIEARLDPDRLLVLVKGDFTWGDFGMTAPTSRFFVVTDDVHFEVLVSAVPE